MSADNIQLARKYQDAVYVWETKLSFLPPDLTRLCPEVKPEGQFRKFSDEKSAEVYIRHQEQESYFEYGTSWLLPMENTKGS